MPCSRLAALTLALAALPAAAQQIEPRSYSNVPVGVNFLLAGYGWTQGGVLVDPSLPIRDVSATVNGLIAGYARGIRVGSQSGLVSLAVPWATINASGVLPSGEGQVTRTGFGDPALKLSVNLAGAPAMSVSEFRGWRQETIVGASLSVLAPWGEYDRQRLVNVGTNRWIVKPEIGVSRRFGDFTLETALGVTLYGANEEFFPGTSRKEQDPLGSIQFHGIYEFRPGAWVSASATWYGGGRTTVNGVRMDDQLQNWRWGLTLALPIDRRNSIKITASTGVAVRAGSDFDAVVAAWQYRFGGGL